MNAYRAKPNNVPWPPIISISSILLSILLGLLYTPGLPDSALLRLFGAALAVTAVFLSAWAVLTLISARTTVLSHRGSDHLVTTGPYAISRNPIYLAQPLLLAGLGLATTNSWFLIFAVITGLSTYALGIRREEEHLLARFGAEYEFYCRRVRRWL